MNTKMFNIMSHCAILCSVTQLCPTLCDPMDCSPPGSSVHGDSPGQNTGMGCHALIQEIFPTQGLKPGLPHCRQILYHLSHQGSPRILQCIVYPFSRGASQPWNWTRVSCVLGRAKLPRKPHESLRKSNQVLVSYISTLLKQAIFKILIVQTKYWWGIQGNWNAPKVLLGMQMGTVIHFMKPHAHIKVLRICS